MLPRKRFGQHFLHNPAIIARIVNAIDPKPGERLVEIGPGLGAITLPLFDRHPDQPIEIDAIEIDRDAIRELRTKIPHQRLRIHEADALKFDFSSLSRGAHSLRIVGNLPYNISTPLLFHLMEYRAHIHNMHFMLQKEVVDRMAAAPGDDAYGRLTVMLAPYVKVESLFDIGPGAFRPPPKIMSSFFRLTPHLTPPFAIHSHSAFAKVVSAAFSQRRKTLRNALKSLLSIEQIQRCDVDPGARAEVISPQQFALLSEQISTQQGPLDEADQAV
jgi:16S rRNA (adenine1518-N6/adenine1519-N6)-dimethyltransferase